MGLRRQAYIGVQSVACCTGLHPFQDRSAAVARRKAQACHGDALVPAPRQQPLELVPGVKEALLALPTGCSPEQCRSAVASIMRGLATQHLVLSEDELLALCRQVREVAMGRCNLRPTHDQLAAAIAWASQTHAMALRRPDTNFHKRLLCDHPSGTSWYLCGSADLVGADAVVLVKVRLHGLRYSLAPYEEAALQALMHLCDMPMAGLLEVHGGEGMTLQLAERKAEEWVALSRGLLEFIGEVEGCSAS